MRARIYVSFLIIALLCIDAFADVMARTIPLRKHEIDLGFCLAVSRGQAPSNTSKCPAFIADQREADTLCRDMQGVLQAAEKSAVFALDIDGDGVDEYLFEFNENFYCPNAAALFSCGDSACPWTLYRETVAGSRADGWQPLGTFPAGAQFAAIARAGDDAHPDLRISCRGETVCEPGLYRWSGSQYEEVERNVHGFAVQRWPAARLVTPAHGVAVLAAPKVGGRVIGEYDGAAIFAVFGEVSGTGFVAVSPCNACENGFVLKRDLGL